MKYLSVENYFKNRMRLILIGWSEGPLESTSTSAPAVPLCARSDVAVSCSCHMCHISSTLLNLCYGELRQKWGQPGASKVYLIKRLVTIYKLGSGSHKITNYCQI